MVGTEVGNQESASLTGEHAMDGRTIAKPIVVATLICGTLDILWAVILTVWRGREPAAMLRAVAPERDRLGSERIDPRFDCALHAHGHHGCHIRGGGAENSRAARSALASRLDLRPGHLCRHEPYRRAAPFPGGVAPVCLVHIHAAFRACRPGGLANRIRLTAVHARVRFFLRMVRIIVYVELHDRLCLQPNYRE
jgi:hypothetical protein